MVKEWLCSALALIVCTSVQANDFAFHEQDGQVLPEEQVWRVAAVQLSPEAPRDLGGLPVIMRGTPVVFGRDYLSMLSPNRGGMMLIPSCYVRADKRILLYGIPGLGRSAVPEGSAIELNDEQLVLKVDPSMALILDQKGFSHPLAEQVLKNAPVRMKERRANEAGVDRCSNLAKQQVSEPELGSIRAKLRQAGIDRHETGRFASEQIAHSLSATELEQWIVSRRDALNEQDYHAFLSAADSGKNKDFEKAAVVSKAMPAVTQKAEGGMVDLALFYKDVPTLLRLLRKVSASDSLKQGWLLTALRADDAELVELILGEGGRPKVSDAFMSYVANCKDPNIPKVLDRYGVEMERLMASAIRSKNRAQVEYLLNAGKRVQAARDYVQAERSFADDPALLARLRSAIVFDAAEIEQHKKNCKPASVGLGIELCEK